MNPQDGYISFIMNPKAGASSAKPLCQRFRQYLTDKGFELQVSTTKSLEHACELACDAASSYDCITVVVAGGDGTVREVAHGLEGSNTPLLMIPSGTENLLASELGIDERLKTLVNAFESQTLRRLDLGRVNGQCFTSIAGFGFDGDVVARVNEKRKGNISYLTYVGPLWRAFWGHNFPVMKVEVDGEEFFDGRGLVFVGNIARYGGGFRILRDADHSDGLLDICILKCSSRLGLSKQAMMVGLRRHIGNRNVLYRQGKNIKVTSDDPTVNTEIDGDPGPSLPVEIEVVPQAVNCLVPEGARPVGLRTRIRRILGQQRRRIFR